ncbi:hypothetical protein ABKV19_027577 [Rosa sericea]
MEVVEDTLYLQLHKLSAIKSEEALHQLLSTLWKTRKTGLRDKSHLQSLLNLQSLSDLDPVLACLRSLIRKWVHENLTADDLLKLFPPDLPLDLQSILVLSLQKFESQWKDEIAREQPRTRTSGCYQVKTTSLGMSHSLHNDHVAQLTRHEFASEFTPMSPCNLGTLPRLKSMTWTMENCNSGSANKVAVINLKLQDYTKSSLDEIEVKFQLTRDTLDAMLRSLTYIRDQISSVVGAASGPSQKKQKQSDHVV